MKRFNEASLPTAIDMKPDQVFYSFRHTWRDATRELGATADFLKHVGAWAEARVTSDIYGSSSHPDRYAPVMDRIGFEGLDLFHSISEADAQLRLVGQ